MKKARYILYAVLLAFPWVSQALNPELPLWEPVSFTVGFAVLIFAIEKWAKP